MPPKNWFEPVVNCQLSSCFKLEVVVVSFDWWLKVKQPNRARQHHWITHGCYGTCDPDWSSAGFHIFCHSFLSVDFRWPPWIVRWIGRIRSNIWRIKRGSIAKRSWAKRNDRCFLNRLSWGILKAFETRRYCENVGLIQLGATMNKPSPEGVAVQNVAVARSIWKAPFNASRIDKLLQDHVKVIVSVDGSDQAGHKILLMRSGWSGWCFTLNTWRNRSTVPWWIQVFVMDAGWCRPKLRTLGTNWHRKK